MIECKVRVARANGIIDRAFGETHCTKSLCCSTIPICARLTTGRYSSRSACPARCLYNSSLLPTPPLTHLSDPPVRTQRFGDWLSQRRIGVKCPMFIRLMSFTKLTCQFSHAICWSGNVQVHFSRALPSSCCLFGTHRQRIDIMSLESRTVLAKHNRLFC